jgi:FkbM family methyltransferase
MSTEALAHAGRSEQLRYAILDALRQAEVMADDPERFRTEVRWPLIVALLRDIGNHRLTLDNGLIFEITPASRIEQAALLSREAHPNHLWEPQTTKLLLMLAEGASHVIVGGAYIGDHVLPIASSLCRLQKPGIVHAFEPMAQAYGQLLRNLALNRLANVRSHQMGLWDTSDAQLKVEGPAALGSSAPQTETATAGESVVQSITIDDYVRTQELPTAELIMLDTEGGEERALHGADLLLSRPGLAAPILVFEIHRQFVDWSDGLDSTSVVRYLHSKGYRLFAIRDIHDNFPMHGRTIEVIPIDRVYLEGPPHGFNVLATKEPGLIDRLSLNVVEDVSPKLLHDKNPLLHHPLDGIPWGAAARRLACER